jgi:VanZ family protein
MLFGLLILLLLYLTLKHHSINLLPFRQIDKLQHIAFYALLGLVSLWAFPHRYGRVCILLIVGSALLEWIQPYVGRSGSLADLAANIFGVGMVVIGYRWRVKSGVPGQ